MNQKSDEITELLLRGVSEVVIKEDLEKKLRSGKRLRVKFGIDPTAPEMHVGHLVPLRKLASFQKLGHTVVFIMGDFTAMIGDPTGRNELRKPLTREETRKNAEDYLHEASRVLDIKKAEVHFNSEWFDKMGITGLHELLSKITVQRALERDDFQKRLKEDREISILETIYPVLQGYDSVAIRADIEIGGTDQKFNLLMGRRVQRRYDIPEQNVMTVQLIEGTDGIRKMSKSYGNYISLRDTPADIYGKAMSIPDGLMMKYFQALTDESMAEIELANLPARDLKMKLAKCLVAQLHNTTEAEKAEQEFISLFQKHGTPTGIPEKILQEKNCYVFELLVEIGLAKSNSDGRRLIEGGGVSIDDAKITDPKAQITVGKKTLLVKVGKRHFLKVRAT